MPPCIYTLSLHDALPIFHFDHACGLTRWDGEKYVPVFENIPIYTSAIEWHEMRYPNIRSVNTYWKIDRQSTRLNSSHVAISYAVFCLKKKIREAFHEVTI